MAVGLVTVNTEAAGEMWSNTWGIQVGGTDGQNVDEPDILAAIGGSDLSNLATDPTPGNNLYDGGTSILAAIIGFHRAITFNNARVASVYVSDGLTNPAASTFYTRALGYLCVNNYGGNTQTTDTENAPLSVAWLVKRNPVGLSAKPGRLYLRDCLPDTAVKQGTRVGVDWTSSAIATSYANGLTTAISNSGLFAYFGLTGGVPEATSLGIPRYRPAIHPQAGDLYDIVEIASLTSDKPVARQLTRGRRKKVSG